VGDAKKNKRVPRKIFEPTSKIVKKGLYKDEQEVLQWILHNQAEQKINYYNKKIAEMRQKYDMDFSAFESRVCLGAEEEDFFSDFPSSRLPEGRREFSVETIAFFISIASPDFSRP